MIALTNSITGGEMKKLYHVFAVAMVAVLALSACGGGGGSTADNLLDAIKERGYVMISTDPNYEPQSFLNTDGSRPSDTKCPSDALTTAEMQGFDVEVGIAVGDGLGVETCFATPDWDIITAGSWANKWDLSIGSMTITTARLQVLDFSVPYYYSPAVIAVRADAGVASLADLDGQALCVGSATTYDQWLNGDFEGLGLPESSIYAQPPSVTVVPLPTDQECAQAIAAGREDFVGYVTSMTVVNANIAAGFPVVQLGSPVYSEELAASFDKSSSLPTDTLREEVNRIFTAMHSDGRLSDLSIKWLGEDLTKDPN
jgi:polar amino acid transport system substrate-binding protein